MSIFICAEIGLNHNGDMHICKALIDLAADAGCDAVKFQKRDIDLVYTREFLDSPRESPWGLTQRDQKRGLEFTEDNYFEIDQYCKDKGIVWYASAWDTNSQEFLRRFELKFNKVASAMIPHTKLLEMIASEGKHTFISTGMSTFDDIDRAVSIFSRMNCPFELMHTVSTYPMRDEHANLRMIQTLRDRYACNVGYSGHEVGVSVSLAAAALGITSLERHITLDRAMYGSDQSASLEPQGLRLLVGGVRKIELALGDGVRRVIPEEIPVAEKLRGHINLEANGRRYGQ
jgi:N-acetylneuraminate synthase